MAKRQPGLCRCTRAGGLNAASPRTRRKHKCRHACLRTGAGRRAGGHRAGKYYDAHRARKATPNTDARRHPTPTPEVPARFTPGPPGPTGHPKRCPTHTGRAWRRPTPSTGRRAFPMPARRPELPRGLRGRRAAHAGLPWGLWPAARAPRAASPRRRVLDPLALVQVVVHLHVDDVLLEPRPLRGRAFPVEVVRPDQQGGLVGQDVVLVLPGRAVAESDHG